MEVVALGTSAGAPGPAASAGALPLAARRGPSFSSAGTPLHGGGGAHADASRAAEGATQLLQGARDAATAEVRV